MRLSLLSCALATRAPAATRSHPAATSGPRSPRSGRRHSSLGARSAEGAPPRPRKPAQRSAHAPRARPHSLLRRPPRRSAGLPAASAPPRCGGCTVGRGRAGTAGGAGRGRAARSLAAGRGVVQRCRHRRTEPPAVERGWRGGRRWLPAAPRPSGAECTYP